MDFRPTAVTRHSTATGLDNFFGDTLVDASFSGIFGITFQGHCVAVGTIRTFKVFKLEVKRICNQKSLNISASIGKKSVT